VELPKGVTANITDTMVSVKGPKGQLEVTRHPVVGIKEEDGKLLFSRESDHPKHRSAHGLMRALCNNAVVGVSKGWERRLEINGVGYRAEVSGKKLTLQLGYSHPIEYDLPEGVSAKIDKNQIVLECIDKQVLGAAAAKIRSFRPPEPYKGKGVKYAEEQIQRKVGKAAG
jgi:large subunit ribosomal protein L6